MLLAARQELAVDGAVYRVAPHPAVPDCPYGQEGRQAVVYQLLPAAPGADGGRPWALKVFKPRFRRPALVALAERLEPLAALDGLEVCRRVVLTPQRHGPLLRQHPSLLYAVLMPWVPGPTWMEWMLARRELSPAESLRLAWHLARLLATLEQRGAAHCDLSGANLILPGLYPDTPADLPPVALVDVEQMYGPGLERPGELPAGSPGYAHREAAAGVWSPEADRFAGAVLLAELLGWCDERVRRAAWGESYFAAEELPGAASAGPGPCAAPPAGYGSGPNPERYLLLTDVLRERWGEPVAAAFVQAWRSETLAGCPSFGEWLLALPEPPGAAASPAATAPPGLAAVPLPADGPHPAGAVPNSPAGHLAAARTAEAAGDLAGALEGYRRALAAAPHGSSLAVELALIVERLAAAVPGASVPPAGEAAAGMAAAPAPAPAAAPATPPAPARRGPGPLPAAPDLGNSDRPPVQRRFLQDRRQHVHALAFSPDGRVLAAGSADGTVRLWQVADGSLIGTLTGHGAPVRSVAVSPGGDLVAAGVWDSTIRLWRPAGGSPVATLRGHLGPVWAVAFSPDGAWLASAAGDGTVRIWHLADGSLTATLAGHTGAVCALAFAPDGTCLASGGDDGIRLWRWPLRSGHRTLPRHGAAVRSLAFSPDGRLLAAGHADCLVRLWELPAGHLRRPLEGHRAQVTAVAFSPDGALIASGAGDRTVRLWRPDGGEPVCTLRGHFHPVTAVAFAPAGDLLASGSHEGVRLWGVP